MRADSVPSGKMVRIAQYSEASVVGGYRAPVGTRGLLVDHGGLRLLAPRGTATNFVYSVSADAEVEVLHSSKGLGDTPTQIYERGSVTLGADPELFVTVDGVVLPAFEFLPPKPKNGPPQLFWDGFQAEFTTQPTYCLDSHVQEIKNALVKLIGIATAFNKKAKLTSACVVEVPEDLMASCTHEQVALGCSPSSNIYPGVQQLAVEGRQLSIRFAGHHMHFGLPGLQKPEVLHRSVRLADAIYGVASVSLLAGLEDERRRMFYGRAGEYRLPAHGLEYRVPSSVTMCHPTVTYLSSDLARFALLCGLYNVDVGWDAGGDDRVQHIVNELDVKGARSVLEKNSTTLSRILYSLYAEAHIKAKRLILSGANECLPTSDIEKSWFPEGGIYNSRVGRLP